MLDRLASDLRYGLRMLRKTPGASATVLIALSLGIGLSALTFSLISRAVLTALPSDGGDRVVRIHRAAGVPWTAQDYATWSVRQRSFDGLGAAEAATVALGIEGRATEPVSGAAITPSVLSLLSTEPVLGRAFTAEDAARGAPPVVLVGHSLWRDRLGADPNVLGTVVRVNGRPAEIVGVLPEGFGFPWDQQLWWPLELDPLRPERDEGTRSLETRPLVGRLRDGVSAEDAAAELSAITRELDAETLGADDGARSIIRVTRYTDLFNQPGQSAALALLLLGLALLVLLVACANVTNVLLARAMDRTREIAVRLAVGASRGRVVAQLLAELAPLALAGAVGGALIALAGTRFVHAIMPPGMPYWIDFRLDLPVLGFIAVAAALAALSAGLMPAVRASRAEPHEALKDTGRGSSSFGTGRIMRRLIGVEMAVSFVLLVLAGLFIRSGVNFRAVRFPFEPEEVYTANIGLPETIQGDASDRVRFLEALREAVAELPQVEGVAMATAVPGVGSSGILPVEIDGAEETGLRARSIVVTPGYLELFRAPVLAGRDFDAQDRADAVPVAIVNDAFARRHLPRGALGRRIRHPTGGDTEQWLTIVGVVPDLMAGGVEGEVPEAVYVPLAQNDRSALRLIARPRGDFASLPAPIRESVAAIDPDVALSDVLPLERVIALANSQYTWFSLVFVISGGIALFLATIGLYGVMAFWVVQRTREIGVRMALGGQGGDIVRLVLGQGLRQISLGLLAGVLLAIPAARLLRAGLFDVAPHDPVVFLGVGAVLVAAAGLGCWLPARRATRMSPLDALAVE